MSKEKTIFLHGHPFVSGRVVLCGPLCGSMKIVADELAEAAQTVRFVMAANRDGVGVPEDGPEGEAIAKHLDGIRESLQGLRNVLQGKAVYTFDGDEITGLETSPLQVDATTRNVKTHPSGYLGTACITND